MKTQQLEMFAEPDATPDLASYRWIVVSTSAGKDSMAMLDTVCEQAEAAGLLSRVVGIHCDLGRVEWPGTRELAQKQCDRYGIRLIIAHRKQGDLLQQIEGMGFFPKPTTRYCTSDHKRDQIIKTFTALATEAREGDLLEQVERRGMWPSARARYRTSDQKRAPVHKVLTALTNAAAIKDAPVRILSCQGMRGEESPARAKRPPFMLDTRASNGRRHVDNWLPIHKWKESEVWQRIRASRISDLIHPAYGLGLPRLSCCFCIFAPRAALVIAGKHNPELLAEYVRVEKQIGHKFRVNLSMADVAEAVAAGECPTEVETWKM